MALELGAGQLPEVDQEYVALLPDYHEEVVWVNRGGNALADTIARLT